MEYLLTGIILALLIERYHTFKTFQKERMELIDKLFLVSSELEEKEDIINETPVVQEDLTPLEDVLDDKFMQAIHGEQSN